MNEKMVVREWYDEDNERVYHIRFIKVNDMWYAVLKDICDALGLYSWKVAQLTYLQGMIDARVII